MYKKIAYLFLAVCMIFCLSSCIAEGTSGKLIKNHVSTTQPSEGSSNSTARPSDNYQLTTIPPSEEIPNSTARPSDNYQLTTIPTSEEIQNSTVQPSDNYQFTTTPPSEERQNNTVQPSKASQTHSVVGGTPKKTETTTAISATQSADCQGVPNNPAESLQPRPSHIHSYYNPTCTLPMQCSCGDTLGKALGHNFNNATCTSPRICNRCGVINGSALGHDYTLTASKASTYVEVGYKKYTCSVCNQTKTDELSLLKPIVSFSVNDYGKANVLKTNCGNNGITFTIIGSTLKAAGSVELNNLLMLRICCGSVYKNIGVSSNEYFEISLDISQITKEECIWVYARQENTGKLYEDDRYWSLYGVTKLGPSSSGGYEFKYNSSVLEKNLCLMNEEANPNRYRYEIPEDAKAMADSICAGVSDDYKKMELLNKWVAENIYYDYDYYYGNSTEIYYSPSSVLRERRTVCEGYARLLVAMLRAQGILAHKITCASNGAYGTGNSNHAYVEAYLAEQKRWVIMDPTWDSGNRYENGQKIAGRTKEVYFDITVDMLSFSHEIVER